MLFCCRGAAERHRWPGDAAAAAEEGESSQQGSSAGLGLDIHVELQPGNASVSPLPTS